MTVPQRTEERGTGTEPLLDVRGLNVTYRSGKEPVYATRGVDLTLAAGETLGMAGESGCGKTTVAMSLLRLLPADGAQRLAVITKDCD